VQRVNPSTLVRSKLGSWRRERAVDLTFAPSGHAESRALTAMGLDLAKVREAVLRG